MEKTTNSTGNREMSIIHLDTRKTEDSIADPQVHTAHPRSYHSWMTKPTIQDPCFLLITVAVITIITNNYNISHKTKNFIYQSSIWATAKLKICCIRIIIKFETDAQWCKPVLFLFQCYHQKHLDFCLNLSNYNINNNQ